jgi:YceI-like domain
MPVHQTTKLYTMKKQFLFAVLILLATLQSTAQKLYTKNGSTSFFSSTSMEDIKAANNQVLCVLNTQTGDLQFSLLNKGFHFAKALMEEHFTVKGDLNIHGVTKNISTAGNIIVKAGKATASSKFTVKLADYNIKIPGAVKNNISETIEITVNCTLDQKMQ